MPPDAPAELVALVARFREHRDAYVAGDYNETQVRREYIDPFFKLLGWDVDNQAGKAMAYQDVVHEDKVKVGGATKAPDYSFRIGGQRKFFVEAKKPAVDVKGDIEPAFQVRRYAFSAGLSLSILTDFDEFAVYDCRHKPSPKDKAHKHRLFYCKFDEYEKHWDFIAGHFTREAIEKGAFDKLAEEKGGKRKGTAAVDAEFLETLEGWRGDLARNIALRNENLSVEELNFAVQATLDRLVFLRIAEDRGIEPLFQLQAHANGERVYLRLCELFRHADRRYNSGLFHFEDEKGRDGAADTLTPHLAVDDKALQNIIKAMYPPECPFAFDVMPAEILGSAYERFLGKVIRLTDGHQAKVEDKPEMKKAGGVFYTPAYIVQHIVKATLDPLLSGKTSDQALKLRVLDPACGSGSFLLGAYQYLLDWHLAQMIQAPEKHAKGRQPDLVESGKGGWRLSVSFRKKLLVSSLYGVDIDAQAVEVTKLSLLLKVLEGETQETLGAQFKLFAERALPDLDQNIQCGNSLIGPEFYSGRLLDDLAPEVKRRVNAFDWKTAFDGNPGNAGLQARRKPGNAGLQARKEKSAESDGAGFDAVVGNPPYVLIQDSLRDDNQLEYFRQKYKAASYKIDLYHLFIEQGVRLLRPGGYCGMITPSNFLTNNFLVGLRRLLLDETKIESIVVIDEGVFDGASVDNAIFVVKSGEATSGEFVLTRAKKGERELEITGQSSVSVAQAKSSEHVLFTSAVEQATLDAWEKTLKKCWLLGEIADVNFGKQLRDRSKYPRDVIEVKDAASVPKTHSPCYTGKNVLRYELGWSHLACLNSTEAQSGGCWDPEKHTAKNKLVTRQIGKFPEFALDANGWACLNTMFMVTVHQEGIDPRYVLGVLNSQVVQGYWVERFYDGRRTFPKIKGTYLKQLPIRKIDLKDKAEKAQHDRIVSLVSQVMELKLRLAAATAPTEKVRVEREIAAAEAEIEKMVAALYAA